MVTTFRSQNRLVIDQTMRRWSDRKQALGLRSVSPPPPQPGGKVCRRPPSPRHLSSDWCFLLLRSHGVDRIGVLAEEVRIVHAEECNIVDIRFQTVGSLHYDCWLHVEGPRRNIDSLVYATSQHPAFSCMFPRAKVSTEPIFRACDNLKWMSVTCADHAGHVLALTEATRDRSINIASLRGHQRTAPISGTVFDSFVVMEGPANPAPWTDLRWELERVKDRYGVVVDGPHPHDGRSGEPRWVA